MYLTKRETQEAIINHIFNHEKDATLETYKSFLKIICYTNKDGQPCLRIYKRLASKPIVAYRYNTIEERDNALKRHKENLLKNIFDREIEKQNRKDERANFVHSVKVGTIFIHSWGYEQTNVDFYQVLEVKNKTATLVRIRSQKVEGTDGHDSCMVIAALNTFTDEDERFKKLILFGDCINMTSYSNAHIWNGKPNYKSWGY